MSDPVICLKAVWRAIHGTMSPFLKSNYVQPNNHAISIHDTTAESGCRVQKNVRLLIFDRFPLYHSQVLQILLQDLRQVS